MENNLEVVELNQEFVDAKQLSEMIISGANNLENHRELVDKLNVFPVPDGDTGTNMSLTMNAAVEELISGNPLTISEIARAISKGSLMGARGNSGVILSQLLRGFANSIEGKDSLNIFDFAQALNQAAQMAYKAVIKPVEGTILTVSRETGEQSLELLKTKTSILEFFENIVQKAQLSLENTPNLLATLKEANVVDAGGKGIVLIFEGMHKALAGRPVEKQMEEHQKVEVELHSMQGEIKFTYCTEFILKTDKIDSEGMLRLIEDKGDSIMSVGDEDLIKIHIHTNEPGYLLQRALEYGELISIKIENMRLQHENRILGEAAEEKQDFKKYGIIAVAAGEGIASIFKDIGTDRVIEGGQTMNPSTNDFIEAIDKVDAEFIIVFPNNKNIIMAANQAKELSQKNVTVIPTQNIPQAFDAIIALNPDGDLQQNVDNMRNAIESVKVGDVTFSVRDTSIGGQAIKEGDIIGISQGELRSTGSDINSVAMEVLEAIVSEDDEIVSIFYGKDLSEEMANRLKQSAQKRFSNAEVEIYHGGQPVYYYIMSAE
ncbi:hypothetical protein EAL2_c14610 [Peptoclostridium acidaminophilum DSM 3953]|uniref:DhaL domain-containing protein n=1 Tax=Peptoclostridium acidaminophilum DSM 3953 TaxID=1286171 RepID=W8U788_PEPAC|nr:hypothetical protein EAL2_c14610 [Peptoclostridium acidaminophilum DSM 3953]